MSYQPHELNDMLAKSQGRKVSYEFNQRHELDVASAFLLEHPESDERDLATHMYGPKVMEDEKAAKALMERAVGLVQYLAAGGDPKADRWEIDGEVQA